MTIFTSLIITQLMCKHLTMGSNYFYITFLVLFFLMLRDHAVNASADAEQEILISRKEFLELKSSSTLDSAAVKRDDDHDHDHDDDDHDHDHDHDHDDHEHGEIGDIGHLFDTTRVKSHTQSEKDAILAKHRYYRSNVKPNATNMEYMTWNDDLATLADLWASVCFPGHGVPENALADNFDSMGQNIEIGPNKPDGVHATERWYDEKLDFKYNRNICNPGKICGHYTQLVWAETTEVGCGRAFCKTTIDKYGHPGTRNNIWIEVCQYAPTGNFVGMQPYKKGDPCTQCRSGSGECHDNICRPCSDHPNDPCECKLQCHKCGTITSDCRCECEQGWSGPDCSTECKDWHDKCWGKWNGPMFCGSAKVQEGCPVMCGMCDPPDTCVA